MSSYRCKELEAVRLKRNESKMKYEFERKLDRYAKHEAVLRRKVSLYTNQDIFNFASALPPPE